jgi:hypothetical protein
MPFQPAVNCAEVVVHGVLNGQQCLNTFYARFGSAYTQADIDALAEAVDTWVDVEFLPQQPNNYSYVRTTVRGLTSAIDLEGENAASAGAGGASTSPFSNNSTLSIKRRSAFTGRGARGRIYLPSPSAGALADDNHVSAAFITTIQGVMNALSGMMADVNWEEVILHRVEAGASLPAAVIFTVVEYVVVDAIIDSMRRRLPGRGV